MAACKQPMSKLPLRAGRVKRSLPAAVLPANPFPRPGPYDHVQERADEGRAIAKVIWHLFERIGVAAWDQRIADEMG
jgi:hypothetical protein